MIEVSNIHKVFNAGKANQVNAVNGVSLDIKNEEFVVIVGSNGSGKTTLLDMIAGSVDATSGKIVIDGNDVTKLQDYRRSRHDATVTHQPIARKGGWAEQRGAAANDRQRERDPLRRIIVKDDTA